MVDPHLEHTQRSYEGNHPAHMAQEVIFITDENGVRHGIEAVEGWRLMEIIRAHGLNLSGMCGGACACATCHVHIAPAWLARLHPPREEEENALDTLPTVSERSRLSCQILYTAALAGLEVQLVGQK